MKTSNVELMKMAEESLSGKWGLAIGTFFGYFIIFAAIQVSSQIFPFGGLISILISGPLSLGIAIFSLNLSRDKILQPDQIFDGFKNFGTSVGAYLLIGIFTVLWTLLFIIPGIIAALSYSMTFYIIADDDSIGPMDAIDKSKEIMDGYKWKYFCLNLRFFGWALLCILTFGIGFLWLIPYIKVSVAHFYDDIKKNQNNKHPRW